MQRNIRWTGLYTALLCVAGFGPARAEIAAVLPAAGGTVDTEMVLVGSGFGDKRGEVLLGTERCTIVEWSDTIVTCEVKTPQPAGDYIVTLLPHGSNHGNRDGLPPMTFSSFAMRAPLITPGEPLRLVTPGERITIAGAFFGDKRGEVYLRDTPGTTVAAKVRDWSMDSISFEIPNGLTGTLALGVENAVGLDIQPLWGTLTPMPPGATAATDYLVNRWANNAPSGVFFNGRLWVFSANRHSGDDSDSINALWYTNGAFVSAPACGGTTYVPVVPLVIDHQLWAFCTGRDGTLCYKRFHTSSNAWDNGDGHWNKIGTLTTDSHREIAPVYDPIRNRIEVYYCYNNTVYYTVSSNRGTNWSSGSTISGLTTYSAVSAPSAVFDQMTATYGLTLLAVGVSASDGTHPAVFPIRDGEVVGMPWFAGPGLAGRPFIADLGEDYLGMTWITAGGKCPLLQKVNRNTGQWLPLATALAKATDCSPNLALNYEQKPAPGELGSRWDAVLCLFWAPREPGSFDYEHWFNAEMTPIEALGYWQEIPDSPQITNLNTNETEFFQLWSAVGFVDAPPFILNGEEYDDNPPELDATRVELGTSTSSATKTETKSTVGPYIETGEKSRLKLELTATVGQQVATEVKKTVIFDTALMRTMAGRVEGCWLAPELKVYKVQWHSAADPTETNNFMYPMVLTPNTSLRCLSFDPAAFPYGNPEGMGATYFPTNFPIHKSETDLGRLATYSITPAQSNWAAALLDWTPSLREGQRWIAENTTNTTKSAALQFKVGASLKKRFGFGVEGQFDMQVETTTTTTTESAIYLINPYFEKPLPTCPNEIEHFSVNVRWLAPSTSDYWVPLNRRGSGDQPWFITYGVPFTSIQIHTNLVATPYLRATLTPTNTVLVWWEVSPTRWRLQATTKLVPSGSAWTEYSYKTNGAICCRIESPPSGNRFYRLQSP